MTDSPPRAASDDERARLGAYVRIEWHAESPGTLVASVRLVQGNKIVRRYKLGSLIAAQLGDFLDEEVAYLLASRGLQRSEGVY